MIKEQKQTTEKRISNTRSYLWKQKFLNFNPGQRERMWLMMKNNFCSFHSFFIVRFHFNIYSIHVPNILDQLFYTSLVFVCTAVKIDHESKERAGHRIYVCLFVEDLFNFLLKRNLKLLKLLQIINCVSNLEPNWTVNKLRSILDFFFYYITVYWINVNTKCRSH